MPGDDGLRPWRLEWEGHAYTDEDMTLGHALAIGAQVGFGWEQLNPWRSLLHLAVFLAVFESVATKVDYPTVALYFNAQPLTAVLGALSERE